MDGTREGWRSASPRVRWSLVAGAVALVLGAMLEGMVDERGATFALRILGIVLILAALLDDRRARP